MDKSAGGIPVIQQCIVDALDDDDDDDANRFSLKRSKGDDSSDGVVSESGEKREPQKKKKKADEDDDAAKKKKKKAAASTPRKQPGYAMIKAEEERLKRAHESLVKKRDAHEAKAAATAKASITCCALMRNDLIDFYEDSLRSFARKFGRYIK